MNLLRLAAPLLLVAFSCTPRAASSAKTGGDTGAVTTAPPVQAVPPAPPVIRATPGPERGPADSLVGTWDFGPPSGLRGPHLTIVIDSASGTAFYGRLIRALSGDVETANFEPFVGSVGADGTARMTIRSSAKGGPATEMAGRISGDTWTGTRLLWGGDDLAAGRTWQGRRVSPHP